MTPATVVEPVVEVAELVVHRGRTPVLDRVGFSLAGGSVTGLIGPSGCGKTTLMRVLVGVQRITSGSARVLGQPAGSAGLRSRVAYTSQSLSIYPDLSVQDNVAYFARLVGAGAGEVRRVIDAVELTDHATRRVDQLSGGQASRVSLACALVGDPEVLVLDEPTVGLDPLTREALWAYFRSLTAEGRTLLVSSHVLEEATRCDQVLLMREGRFLAQAPIGELQRRTSTSTPDAAFMALIEQGA